MHFPPLSPVNRHASDTTYAYYCNGLLQLPCQTWWYIKSTGCATDDGTVHRHGAMRIISCVTEVQRAAKSEKDMSFRNSNGLDELARRLAEAVPESVRAFARDLEGNFKAVLQAQLSKLDLVSRQEFDVQAAILQRTQANLTAMEARLKEIEAKLNAQ